MKLIQFYFMAITNECHTFNLKKTITSETWSKLQSKIQMTFCQELFV